MNPEFMTKEERKAIKFMAFHPLLNGKKKKNKSVKKTKKQEFKRALICHENNDVLSYSSGCCEELYD